MNFIASAAGIVSTFLVLAAALLILRSAGSAIGWGIQFQQPWFLTVLIMIVTIFACNLWGFFEVNLPSTLSNFSQKTLKNSENIENLENIDIRFWGFRGFREFRGFLGFRGFRGFHKPREPRKPWKPCGGTMILSNLANYCFGIPKHVGFRSLK